MDTSNYTVNAKTLNGYISTLNSWAKSMAREQGLGYVDTWSVLTDESGFLKESLHVGDGHHLNAQAYTKMLEYIGNFSDTEDI